MVMREKPLGTPLFEGSVKLMLLGGGELGKEVVIEAQRMGIETIVVDRYENSPASQMAHRAYTTNMRDGNSLRALIHREKPDLIIPEVEAIDTDALKEVEEEGFTVMPGAETTRITMDRFLIRRLAAEGAKVPTSLYRFATNLEEAYEGCEAIGYPCLVKSRMSSGGLGSSVVKSKEDVREAYEISKKFARGKGDEVLVEGIIHFDLEVTELVLAHLDGEGKPTLTLLSPVGHVRSGGHYHVSWQPFVMQGIPFQGFGSNLHLLEDPPKGKLPWSSPWNGGTLSPANTRKVESRIYEVARKVVENLPNPKRGHKLGIFGCELFIKLGEKGEGMEAETHFEPKVYFNEVSPRPHDTGMVTLVTQDLSEMSLHVKAVLGLPIPSVKFLVPGASHVVLAQHEAWGPKYRNMEKVLGVEGVHVRIFGKPYSYHERRMGLVLSTDDEVNGARVKACRAAHLLEEGVIYE